MHTDTGTAEQLDRRTWTESTAGSYYAHLINSVWWAMTAAVHFTKSQKPTSTRHVDKHSKRIATENNRDNKNIFKCYKIWLGPKIWMYVAYEQHNLWWNVRGVYVYRIINNKKYEGIQKKPNGIYFRKGNNVHLMNIFPFWCPTRK